MQKLQNKKNLGARLKRNNNSHLAAENPGENPGKTVKMSTSRKRKPATSNTPSGTAAQKTQFKGSSPARGTKSTIKAFKSLQILDLQAFVFNQSIKIFKNNQYLSASIVRLIS